MQRVDADVSSGRVLAAGHGRAVRAGPFDMRVKVESAETGGAFAFIEYTLPANVWEGPAPHIHHAGSETFYVLEGTLQMLVGDKSVAVTAGTCVHVPSGAVHAFSNPGPGAVRLLQIVSPGSLLTMIEEIVALLEAGIQDRAQIAAVFRRHESEVVAR
jgi:mannose-6-phosphate isomerase-like protein (cupin superfamily)